MTPKKEITSFFGRSGWRGLRRGGHKPCYCDQASNLAVQVHALISFTADQATQGVRGCVRTERNKGCPHLKKRPGPDGPSIPHVMSGPVQKSQYPSQERAVIGGAAPQKSLILTENGPFPQNFGAYPGSGLRSGSGTTGQRAIDGKLYSQQSDARSQRDRSATRAFG